MVAISPAAQEVASVGPQPFGDALRRRGPALELQQEGTPFALVLQGERGVGVDDVGRPVVAIADGGAGRGQQVEQVVVRGAGDLGREGGGKADDAGVVAHLG